MMPGSAFSTNGSGLKIWTDVDEEYRVYITPENIPELFEKNSPIDQN